jgi:hypothetical protein
MSTLMQQVRMVERNYKPHSDNNLFYFFTI